MEFQLFLLTNKKILDRGMERRVPFVGGGYDRETNKIMFLKD